MAYTKLLDKYWRRSDTLDIIKVNIKQLLKNELLTFGYCPLCSMLTQYTGRYGPETCSEVCHNCNSVFESAGALLYAKREKYLTGNDIPASMQEETKILNSKNFQIDLLQYSLSEYAKRCKKETSRLLHKMKEELKEVGETQKLARSLKKD